MYAPRPPSTTISAIVDRRPRILTPPQPCVDAGPEDEARDDEQREPREVGLLRRREDQPAIVGLFRADGDQVFLLREPAHDVHEEIAVAHRGLALAAGKPDRHP